MTIAPCAWAIAATSAGRRASVNPLMRSSTDGPGGRPAPGRRPARASKSAARVRFVVPTSTSRAPARRDDLRDPDAAADLDELATRDTTTPPRRPASPTASAQGRGVVRHDQRVLGAGQGAEMLLGAVEAPAAAAGRLVELEVAVRRRGGHGGHARGARPRRTSEVRVEDHPGRVDDVRRHRQRLVAQLPQPIHHGAGEVRLRRRRRPGRQPSTLLGEHVANERHDRVPLGDLDPLGLENLQHPVDARRAGLERCGQRTSWRRERAGTPGHQRGAAPAEEASATAARRRFCRNGLGSPGACPASIPIDDSQRRPRSR